MLKNQKSEDPNNDSQLIDLVDEEFEKGYLKLFFSRHPFSVYVKLITIFGSIVGFSVIAASLIRILNSLQAILETATSDQTIMVLLAIIAIFANLVIFPFVTVGTIKSSSKFDVLVYHNYNALKKKVKTKELHPKLMALIILRSKHPDFLLKKFYAKDETLTDSEVLKILYDHPVTKVDF